MYAGITLVVAIAYTFLLRFAAFPLILTIMVSIWVMLLCACGILVLKAGYIDAKSIPGSDFAATSMPEVKRTTRVHISTAAGMLHWSAAVPALTRQIFRGLCAGRDIWASRDEQTDGCGGCCDSRHLLRSLFPCAVHHGKHF